MNPVASAPVASMTGVGAASGDTELGRTIVELRAVNGRGLSVKQRLPAAAAGLEAAIEKSVAARVRRGTVTCVIEVAGGEPTRGIAVDPAAFAAAVRELRAAAVAAGLAPDIALRDVLALPGIVADPGEPARVSRAPSAAFLAVLDAALQALAETRRREGEATCVHVAALLAALAAARERVAARAQAMLADYRSKLLARVNEFVAALAAQGKSIGPDDVVREVALFTDRSDVTEELHRLAGHLAHVQTLITQGGEVGRPLEFLAQELLREVNTLGSKAQDLEIAHEVVGMKSHIDKLRELVANLE